MKTLVLGGYGHFGARICRALADDPAIALVIGGRDAARGAALASALGGSVTAIAIDHHSPHLVDALRRNAIELVIHSAGPFQAQAYDVARAAAAAKAHYIDLADARRFVCDFAAAMDPDFQAAGRSALSGASTVPALSSAVVDALCHRWHRVDCIDLCIAPAQQAPRGLATMQAVLGYCGAPIQVWADGRWQRRSGWARPERVTFARLRPRRGALCDIPDLELFPPRYLATQRVMFRAALELGIAQRALAGLAALRRWGLVQQPERLAGAVLRADRWLDTLGGALGGMVVEVSGLDADGRDARRAWHIAAGHNHGPEIPCMAAILLARRLARGDELPIGARPCMGLLGLDDFASEFARWGMVTDIVDGEAP